MTEVSEAQGIVAGRKAQISPVTEGMTPESPAQTPQINEGNWISKLFKRGKRTSSQAPTQDRQIGEVAIDRQGNAVHGIGEELSEQELSRLEGKTEGEGSTQNAPGPQEKPLPPMAQAGVNRILDQYKQTQEDGHSFDPATEPPVFDQIGTGSKIENPPYEPGTAENVTPISGNAQPSPKKTGW